MLDILFQFLDSTKQKLCFWTKGAAVLRKDRKIENQSGLLWACSILIKPVCHHFTSNNNVAALWSKMKESLAKQCGSVVYLFQWKVFCLLGVRGNVMDAWHFPRLCMSTAFVCVCECLCPPWKQMLSSLISFAVTYLIFFSPPPSLSLMASSANNLDPFCVPSSHRQHIKIANLSGWMVFCAAFSLYQSFFFAL